MLESTLKSAGIPCSVTKQPSEVVDLVSTGDVSVVIADWNMPEMTGPELCRAIRETGPDRYVYLILLTSRSDPSEVLEGLESGADEFMIKPFNPPELVKRVQIGLRIAALDTRDATIFALAKLAESRDPETGAHLERVRNYSRVLGQWAAERGYHGSMSPTDFTRLLYATTPLHDIGKVAIPDSVLLKPGRLSDREFDIMKAHTTIGAETLQAVAERFPQAPFLSTACVIARSHHERWDGGGYPDKLAGEDIPVAARIMSVADVYDALVSRRVYKAAMEHEVAASIILEGAGEQFDPTLVQGFSELQDEFIRIKKHFDEPLAEAA